MSGGVGRGLVVVDIEEWKGPKVISSRSNVNLGQDSRLSPSWSNVNSGQGPRLSPSGLNVSQLVCRVCCLIEALLVRLTHVAILGSDQILTIIDAPSALSLRSR